MVLATRRATPEHRESCKEPKLQGAKAIQRGYGIIWYFYMRALRTVDLVTFISIAVGNKRAMALETRELS